MGKPRRARRKLKHSPWVLGLRLRQSPWARCGVRYRFDNWTGAAEEITCRACRESLLEEVAGDLARLEASPNGR